MSTLLLATLVLGHARVSSSGEKSIWDEAADDRRPLAGVFYGNPLGGIGTANARIATVSSRRFRAERHGSVKSVRFNNRILSDENIKSRCESQGSESVWCRCLVAELDSLSCGYTLPNSYSVGNGGTIVVELRTDDGAGAPSETVLTASEPYVPFEFADVQYLTRRFRESAELELGRVYHLVFVNLNPPRRCELSHVSIETARTCPRDSGAIGLNGLLLPDAPDRRGRHGPYYGGNAAANLYKRDEDDPWKVHETTLAWFEVQYTDGTWIGDAYHSYDSASTGSTVVEGLARARQRFTLRQPDVDVDGVWLQVGRTPDANGRPLFAELKSAAGRVLATTKFPVPRDCKGQATSVRTRAIHCRDWIYGSFGKKVKLERRAEYSLELSAEDGAGYVLSSHVAMIRQGFRSRNIWPDSRAELSTKDPVSWTAWSDRAPDSRDLAVLFTLADMPRELD